MQKDRDLYLKKQIMADILTRDIVCLVRDRGSELSEEVKLAATFKAVYMIFTEFVYKKTDFENCLKDTVISDMLKSSICFFNEEDPFIDEFKKNLEDKLFKKDSSD